MLPPSSDCGHIWRNRFCDRCFRDWCYTFEELDMANRTAVTISREIAQIKASPFAQHLKDAAIKLLMDEAESLLAQASLDLGARKQAPAGSGTQVALGTKG